MRLVLDTNVVVSGLLWRGSPRQVIEAGRQGMAAFFSSAILLDELASVLKRDKFSALLTSRKVTPSLLMRRYGMFARWLTRHRLNTSCRLMKMTITWSRPRWEHVQTPS